MRLLICDGEPADIHTALGNIDAPGASVTINPQWITPDPSERLWIACGKAALTMVQSAGWLSKKGGVMSNRGKLFSGIQPDGWLKPIDLGVTYAPQIMHINYAEFVTFQTDIAIYRRYEKTGSMSPILGKYAYTSDLSGVIRYLKAKHKATGQPVELALDTETEGLDPHDPDKRIVCIQATAQEGIADVVYTYSMSWAYIQDRIIPQLQWIADQPWIKIIGANFKFDMNWLRKKWGIVFKNFTFDTCNGGSLCEENRANTLNLHTKIYSPDLGGYDDAFNVKHDKSKMGDVAKEDLLPYAGGDTDACLRNYRQIRHQLLSDNLTASGKPAKNSLTSVYIHIVHPALKALHKMEYGGVCVDEEKFHAFGADLENRMTEATVRAASVLPKSIIEKYGGVNAIGGAPLSKPHMIAEFLFSPTGLNLTPTEVTAKTQKPSTAEHHLAQFKDHPEAAEVIEHYLDYKRVSKMHGTYYVGFLSHLRADGRWHPSYIIHKQGDDKNNDQAAAGTVTGRGSATAPAFQCVTGDTEILTDKGIKTAASLIDPLIPDNAYSPFKKATIWIAGTGGMNTTSTVFKSWRHDLLKVTLRNGNELRCTPEHPFLCTGREWVKAEDLTKFHRLAEPRKQARAPAPFWATPKVSELLGYVSGIASLAMTAPMIYFQVPEAYGAELKLRMSDTLGVPVSLSYFEGKAVVSYSFDLCTTMPSKLFTLNLPDPDYAGPPRDMRGTVAIYDYLRGFLSAAGTFDIVGNGVYRIQTTTTRLDAARAIQRETAIEGVQPPRIVKKAGKYLLDWQGRAAAVIAEAVGRSDLGWHIPPRRPHKWHRLLQVASIEPAGAGWVYDFTVPSTHDFYANGMLVHNTVPKHSYWGKRIRECIVAPEGYKIIARDYSQGELKVAACWAQETKMIEAYLNGIDLHTLTAATVNSMSYEEAMFLKKQDLPAYEKLRQNGKAGNFGLLYGMGAYGFMMYAEAVYGVKLTLEEAEHMRDAYFDLYPGLTWWHERQIIEAQQYGAVRSPLGRLRHLPTINSPIKATRSGTQKQAINSPIQATLVDMMWWSMGIIEQERPELLAPFAQVHDQGLWYVPENGVEEALAYSGEVMENLPFEEKFGWKPELIFNTDAEVGDNLANLKKV